MNKPIGYSTVNSPDARWSKGPRVRVETLARDVLFLAIDGERYRYVRPDGALSGVHHVTHEGDHQSTSFAGCAEVVALEELRSKTQHRDRCDTCGSRVTTERLVIAGDPQYYPVLAICGNPACATRK